MKSMRFRRLIAGLLALSLCATGTLPAYAGIVGTHTVIAGADRGMLGVVVDRADVRARLQAMGVDPRELQARVAALSDEEAAQLAARLDELPAGGDVLGVLVFVFLVLLFTDIMGWTKIFPFTRPAQTSK
jgi:uncharacterized Fe-S cluster-containing radical SAM superfamily protein